MSERIFDIEIGPTSVQSRVKVNGQDISSAVRRVMVECVAGEVTKVTLDLHRDVFARVQGAIEALDVTVLPRIQEEVA